MNELGWEAFRGPVSTGIIESNLDYARRYWQERADKTGIIYSLRPADPTGMRPLFPKKKQDRGGEITFRPAIPLARRRGRS